MAGERTNTLVIKTPEGIEFSLLLAGPITRFVAWAIDIACIAVAGNILGALLGTLGIISLDFAQAAAILAYFVVQIGYGIFLEWHWRGQTVGKRVMRLRVMDEQGLQLQFNQIVIRNLLRFIDSLPVCYLVGGLACLASRRAQRLGDFAANTIVVRNPAILVPDLEQLMGGKYNSFRDYPHLEARLRQEVTPQEAALALHALVRRDDLETEARVELFADIAAYFKSVVAFPEEAVFGLTDEQYVRNVVETVFRPRAGEKRPPPAGKA